MGLTSLGHLKMWFPLAWLPGADAIIITTGLESIITKSSSTMSTDFLGVIRRMTDLLTGTRSGLALISQIPGSKPELKCKHRSSRRKRCKYDNIVMISDQMRIMNICFLSSCTIVKTFHILFYSEIQDISYINS